MCNTQQTPFNGHTIYKRSTDYWTGLAWTSAAERQLCGSDWGSVSAFNNNMSRYTKLKRWNPLRHYWKYAGKSSDPLDLSVHFQTNHNDCLGSPLQKFHRTCTFGWMMCVLFVLSGHVSNWPADKHVIRGGATSVCWGLCLCLVWSLVTGLIVGWRRLNEMMIYWKYWQGHRRSPINSLSLFNNIIGDNGYCVSF